LIVGGDPGVAYEHRDSLSENSQLSGLLLFLSFVVQSQNCLVHDAGKECHLLYLFLFWHSSQFVLQRYSYFGFEEFLLLLATHITNIPKLTRFAKFWNFDIGTAFRTLFSA